MGGYSRLGPISWNRATSIILALVLHMCSGSFVSTRASQSLHWQWVHRGKWRDSGLSQVGLGSSQAMKVHLLWSRGLSLSGGLVAKVHFYRESLKIAS